MISTKQQVQLNQVINQTVQFNSQVEAYATEGCAYLTPDSLMAYCQSRLQGIDTQVNEEFAKQQQANYDQRVLSQILADPALSLPDDPLQAGDASKKLLAVEDAIKQKMANLDHNDPMYKTLDDLRCRISQINVGNGLSPENFKSQVVDQVSAIQKDLNSSAELGMIQLQSLMSQRQSAIQMCTNLVQSLGDQMNKICQNIGH